MDHSRKLKADTAAVAGGVGVVVGGEDDDGNPRHREAGDKEIDNSGSGMPSCIYSCGFCQNRFSTTKPVKVELLVEVKQQCLPHEHNVRSLATCRVYRDPAGDVQS